MATYNIYLGEIGKTGLGDTDKSGVKNQTRKLVWKNYGGWRHCARHLDHYHAGIYSGSRITGLLRQRFEQQYFEVYARKYRRRQR